MPCDLLAPSSIGRAASSTCRSLLNCGSVAMASPQVANCGCASAPVADLTAGDGAEGVGVCSRARWIASRMHASAPRARDNARPPCNGPRAILNSPKRHFQRVATPARASGPALTRKKDDQKREGRRLSHRAAVCAQRDARLCVNGLPADSRVERIVECGHDAQASRLLSSLFRRGVDARAWALVRNLCTGARSSALPARARASCASAAGGARQTGCHANSVGIGSTHANIVTGSFAHAKNTRKTSTCVF